MAFAASDGTSCKPPVTCLSTLQLGGAGVQHALANAKLIEVVQDFGSTHRRKRNSGMPGLQISSQLVLQLLPGDQIPMQPVLLMSSPSVIHPFTCTQLSIMRQNKLGSLPHCFFAVLHPGT